MYQFHRNACLRHLQSNSKGTYKITLALAHVIMGHKYSMLTLLTHCVIIYKHDLDTTKCKRDLVIGA